MKKWQDTIILIAFGIAVLWGLSLWTYNSFYNENNGKAITFNVTGVTDSLNATTLTSLHWTCIQYCIKEYGNYGQSVKDCWKECSTLGQEQCVSVRGGVTK
jgi:hypothetical protein